METSWHSYPRLYALGHSALAELLLDDVIVEEKVDGSQFSFGVFGGELKCRSKGKELIVDAPEKMFTKAVATAKELSPNLIDGYTYRGEYLQSPRHNTQTHDRVPAKHIIIFDIQSGCETYLSPEEKKAEAERLGLETVPLLFSGRLSDAPMLTEFLTLTSVLGGTKIEGVVVKSYKRFGADKKALMGKYVSETFKEVHGKLWKKANPKSGDIIESLIGRYKTEARYSKAVQHLREAGSLEGTPRDIGALIREVQEDVAKECRDEIVQILMDWAWPKVARAIVGGLPGWYKRQLLAQQFVEEPAAS